jgi:hypothetical protein
MRSLRGLLLSFWWISWFGILAAFLFIGGQEFRRESSQGAAASQFSLMLLIIISLSWILFFAADAKTRKRVDGERNKQAVDLLTMTGTILAIFTILGIAFFVDIAPRVQ